LSAGLKVVEGVFERHAQVLRLHVGSAIVGTTAEHPFWVVGTGWVNANALAAGNTLIGKDEQEVAISRVEDTGEWATVYNMRVADWHTYFVGAAEWGFSVWAHNATCTPAQQVGQSAAGSRTSLRNAMQAALGWVAHHIIPVLQYVARLQSKLPIAERS